MDDFDRAAGIGGSDVPAILGISPYATRTDVWMEKTRHPAWRPKPETPEMRFGKLLEPVMRAAYEEDRGLRVHAPGLKTYWAEDHLRFAHIDGLVESEGIWEGKAPFQTWRNWADGPPAYVLAQVQHYLDITGEPWADVTALAAGLDPIFQTWRVRAEPETQAHIAKAVVRFWQDYVLPNEPPDVLPAVIEYPRHKSDMVVVADEDDEALVRLIWKLREGNEGNDAIIDEYRERLKRRIGTAAGMVGDGWRIRFKANKDSVATDWKLVAAAYRRLLEALNPDELQATTGVAESALRILTDTPLDSIVSLYTTEKPGARPFVLEEVKDK
jgi:putative phage-type endonuclease